MTKEAEEVNIERTPTRIVLIEKAPFLVEILNTPMSRIWWYGEYIGEYLFVRNATSDDMKELDKIDKIYSMGKSDPSEYFIVTGDTVGSPIYQSGIVLKQDCKRV